MAASGDVCVFRVQALGYRGTAGRDRVGLRIDVALNTQDMQIETGVRIAVSD